MNLVRHSGWRVLWYIVCSIIELLFLAPILWSFLTSFKISSEANGGIGPKPARPVAAARIMGRSSDMARGCSATSGTVSSWRP
jgi:ABC-type glycerol-3-phosphate transport system permease component